MHIELRHLKTIRAIHEAGGLARAADLLKITQSALSHQIKGLEDQAGMELFVRRTKPMRLSAAGLRMLRTAERILPEMEALEAEFEGLRDGSAGRLHISLECHACFDWLLPVLELFRHAWADVDIDIRAGLAMQGLEALERELVDVVITSEPEDIPGLTFAPIFDYSPAFICPASHPLASKSHIEAEDLATEMLLTYPIDRSKLDVTKTLLDPAGVEPAGFRQVELTEVILLLVASGRGVAVLPDWALREARRKPDFKVLPLTQGGVTRRMYAACRSEEAAKPYMAHFTRLARTEAVKLQRLPES
ncbi:LysR family transcriptional regulator [Pseudooceanicola sp. HF7]|uniref:LysR family transcriptional regulator n=1 Tax=Pseudooceanicola sp. HF7 TaxID=2721560 RepID=UPI001431B27C|nr:LysR family transcriptional regulator [Pseudooceanicola sp. HF7]NIZ10117.1 LysR family transcriptional regulator [Pseudooceanicola sp. HF7]